MVSSPLFFRILGILSTLASLGMAVLTALALGSSPQRPWTAYLLAGLGSLGTMVGIQGAIFLFRKTRPSPGTPPPPNPEDQEARLKDLQAQGGFSFTQAATALGLTPTETETLLQNLLQSKKLVKLSRDGRPYYSFSQEGQHE